jgi:paraquat-inducible protein B
LPRNSGLRAQLRTGNYITGQLYISLDFFPKGKPASLNAAANPVELPTVPGGFQELQSAVQRLVDNLEKVPVESLAADIRSSMRAVEQTLKEVNGLVRRVDSEITPELRATLEQSRATLEQGRATLEQARAAFQQAQGALSDDAPLQGDLRSTLRDVTRATEAIRSLADYLERHPESLIRGRREESRP